jgi:hypothetical protein
MLDVHPPEHTPHSWRDFFIHIATIVIGLLIAIGLEQTVEAIHHHHQARHAREMLAKEMAFNHQLVLEQQFALAMHEDYLFRDLVAIAHIRQHNLTANDHIVLFHPYVALSDAAWQTAKESGAVTLFSYDETQQYATVYNLQDDFNETEATSTAALQNANTMFYRSAADRFNGTKALRAAPGGSYYGKFGMAIAHTAFEDQAPGPDKLALLTPTQVDRLEQAVQQAIYEDEKLINRCHWLSAGYRQFSN